MQNIILFVIATLYLFSCSKEIQIDLPDYDPEIVVDGWISNNNYANILLTKSSPYLTDYDSASIRNTFLNYAKITLTSSTDESEILTLFRKDEFFPPFVYKSVEMKGQAGETYTITVEINDETVTSNTTITPLPAIDSVTSIITSDTTRQFIAYIDDTPEVNNYYYIEIEVVGQDYNFHPAASPLYTDKGKDGEIITLNVLRSHQSDPLNLYEPEVERNLPDYEFHIEDTVFIRISSIDSTSYAVLNDLYLDKLNSDNPFSFINSETATNIDGGIGRWTGMASRTHRMDGIKQED